MAVTQEQVATYQRMMAAGGIVPGSIPADLLLELQAATSGLQTISPIGPTQALVPSGGGGRPDPSQVWAAQNPGQFTPADPTTYPVQAAAFGAAALIPWAATLGMAVWDIFGGGIGGDPGFAPVNGGGAFPAAASAPVPLVGPGVPEPPGYLVKKRWETKVYDNELGYIKLNFYALVDGRIMMYHNTRKYWKIWRPKKSVVISSNPRLSHLKKLDRLNKRVEKIGRKLFPAPKKTSTQAPSKYLSAVERKQLGKG